MKTDMSLNLGGIHHLTAITAHARGNHEFYTQTLGMRLVKRTVNQDDTSAYHLFYGDAAATPGSDITFFEWTMPRERRGTHSIALTSLRVTGQPTLEYWHQRLQSLGIASTGINERDGRLVIDFEDPEGQRLSLIDDGGAGDPGVPWSRSPVPAEHQIRGLGPIGLSVPQLRSTEEILTRVMNLRKVREYGRVHVFEMGGGGPHAELHVAVEPNLPVAHPGAGGVHHVAFRTPNAEEYLEWEKRLNEFGVRNSGQVDRYYFRSLYFREPNGILFEIATDGPGFGVDEDMETLGEKVALPPFLEPQREEIVGNLEPI
jgi:glyoxalase family protein